MKVGEKITDVSRLGNLYQFQKNSAIIIIRMQSAVIELTL